MAERTLLSPCVTGPPTNRRRNGIPLSIFLVQCEHEERKLARLAAATWNKRRTEVDGHNKTPHDLILICFLDSWQKTLLRETRIARKLKDLLQNDFKEPDGPWQTEALSGLGT
jgi:hypothetical protein